MKAILFSNFPKDVYENTLKPKFDLYGVDVLRVVRIDRTDSVDCSQADVLIAMIELMSNGQRDKVKTLARRYSKKYVALSRKGVVWEKTLADMVQQHREAEERRRAPPSSRNVVNLNFDAVRTSRVQTLAPNNQAALPRDESSPSVPSEPEPPEPTTEELQALLRMFEDENEKLEEQKGDLIERLKKSDALAGSLERQLEASKAKITARENRIVDLEKQIASAKSDDQYFNSLVGQNDQLRKELDKSRDQFDKVSDQVHDLKLELAKAQRGAEKESSIEQALEPFKQLWKLGFMTPEEILKKIFKEK